MTFVVEIEGSSSGSRSFTDLQYAREYYQFLLIGLEFMHDLDTNVRLLKYDNHYTYEIIKQRLEKGKPPHASWLAILRNLANEN